MFSTAYKAITMTETWDYIKNIKGSYSYFGPDTDRIYNKIENLAIKDIPDVRLYAP